MICYSTKSLNPDGSCSHKQPSCSSNPPPPPQLDDVGFLPQSAADTADGLQGRELLIVSDVQGFVGIEVFGGQNLLAGGARLTVQLGHGVGPCGRPLLGLVLLVLVSSSSV